MPDRPRRYRSRRSERCHRAIKGGCIRLKTFWRIEDAGWAVTDYVKHCNELLLSGAIGYLTTHAKIAGQEKEVYAARDAKLETAREKSRLRRAAVLQHVP